jgi:hypothetical protein
MDRRIEGFVDGIAIHDAATVDGFTIVPLTCQSEGTLSFTALQDALRQHFVQVREVSASGSVGDLLVSNVGPSLVLALDGEELIGAKQNRILNTTVLLGAGSETVIPVSCTEQGRWAYVSTEFSASSSFAPPRIRENAKRAVNKALEEDRGFRANQGEVWHEVARFAREKGVDSPTGAMEDVVKSRLPELNRALVSLRLRPGQCGLMAIADGHVLGFDIVSRPDVYGHLHQRLVRSYLLETLDTSSRTTSRDPSAAAAAFFEAARSADERSFASVGLGHDYRYSGKGIVGSALAHEGQVVHMAFFHVPPEGAFGWEPRLRSFRTRAGFRRGDSRGEDSGARTD